MASDGWHFSLADMRNSEVDEPGWWIELSRSEPYHNPDAPEGMQDMNVECHYVELDCGAPTIEKAICVAALLSLENR
jgi:hypothetical protein